MKPHDYVGMSPLKSRGAYCRQLLRMGLSNTEVAACVNTRFKPPSWFFSHAWTIGDCAIHRASIYDESGATLLSSKRRPSP